MRAVRIFLVMILLLVLIPATFASLQVTSNAPGYNIEEDINLDITLRQDTSFKGFLRLELVCTNKSPFAFYVTPIAIEQGVTHAVSASVPVAESMTGNCQVAVTVTNGNGNIVDQNHSAAFVITNQLSGNLNLDNDVYKAGERVLISGTIQKASGQDFSGVLDIHYDSKQVASIPVSGFFAYELHLAEHESSGKHYVTVSAQGKNLLRLEFQLYVESEVKDIIVDIKEPAYHPGEMLKALLSLKDQAGITMPGEISIDIVGPKNNWVGTWKAQANTLFEYQLGENAAPGNYTLTARYNSLIVENSFVIREFTKLGFDIKDNIITITNTGNVPYDNTVELYLENPDKKYLFSKQIKLVPGESTVVELHKEVPDNKYTVAIPLLGTATNVTVLDTRTFGEKSKDGLHEISGAVFGGGAVSYIAFTIIVLLFLGAGYYIYRYSSQEKPSEKELRKMQRKQEIHSMLNSLNKK